MIAASKETETVKKSKKPTGKKVATIVINIFTIFSLVILVTVSFIVFKYKDHPNEAFFLNYKPVVVISGSMQPTIKVNGIMLIKKVDYNAVKKNDIISFSFDSNNLVSHRVVDITSEGFITKGDSNASVDPRVVQRENFVGKEVAIMNGVAPIVADFMSNGIMATVRWILLPILLILVVIFIINKIGTLAFGRGRSAK